MHKVSNLVYMLINQKHNNAKNYDVLQDVLGICCLWITVGFAACLLIDTWSYYYHFVGSAFDVLDMNVMLGCVTNKAIYNSLR